MILHVRLHPMDEQGWIVAECPTLPGCFSQGRDQEEALHNIKEAASLWIWAENQKSAEEEPAGQVKFLIAI